MPESDASSNSVVEIFEPFIHDGVVSLKNDLSFTSILKPEPCLDQSPDPIKEEISDLYPSCVFNRAMARAIQMILK